MKYICPFNKTEIKYFPNYIATQSKKFKLSPSELKFQVLKFNFPHLISKEILKELYINKKYSLPMFYKEFGWSYNNTLFLLNYFNIQIRNIKDVGSLYHDKRKSTMVDKYGVDNISKLQECKEKKKKTFIENYGVDNIWKSPKYYEWLDSYMLENYGHKRLGFAVWTKQQRSDNAKKRWETFTPEYREQLIKQIIKNLMSGCNSGLESQITECLTQLGVNFERNFYINRNQYDFYIKNYNLILEIQGDFWHANPNIYKSDDVLMFPNTDGVKASDLWKKDEIKKKKAIDSGYNIDYIWENEIRKSENVIDLILPIFRKYEN
jgi:G:T-mismatch repair DNA endonuclease (very short patch repair protein)